MAQNRRGGASGERFPGVIDPVETKGLIEPEQGLARLLPELFWLERRNARTRHEWCFSLGIKEEGNRSRLFSWTVAVQLALTIALPVVEGKEKAAKMNDPQSEMLAEWARSRRALKPALSEGRAAISMRKQRRLSWRTSRCGCGFEL